MFSHLESELQSGSSCLVAILELSSNYRSCKSLQFFVVRVSSSAPVTCSFAAFVAVNHF